ncbi:hypothetical protein PHBOTO_002177 [Pseudozyma hubeiensis]|nr:hypothetical protein PHBOTO_002177 [Pseudozyma hubeiensis]
MRAFASIALAGVALASFSHAASITLPTLYSCEPATIRVSAQGNYTIEGRNGASRKLVFRAHVNQGVTSVNWDAVDLAANATALITVTDQISASQTSDDAVQALVLANPAGNTTCLVKDKDHRSTPKQKSMVATIIGIALGAFFALVILLIAGMMYRRKRERLEKVEEDSLDLDHSYTQGSVPAGGSYMARLVPGLKLQEARPLPRDPVLESEQANYSSTRRGTQYYKNDTSLDMPYRHQWQPPSQSYRQSSNPFSEQQASTTQQQQQHELLYQQQEKSQSSFLSHNNSK